MRKPEELKQIVQDKYAEIVTQGTSCCDDNCCSPDKTASFLTDEYTNLEGYVADADYNLGCGVPTKLAEIKSADTVLDLGSGAGNDVFIVRSIVGDAGKVIGIDMTPEMIERANTNKQKLGFENIEFKLGDIENMPVENNSIDVVISNCVLNLVPDKAKAFNEIYRVLKPGAHFCVSDIVNDGRIPEGLKESAEAYAGCISGAIAKDEYLSIIEEAGFTNVEVKQSIKTDLPDELLAEYMTQEAIAAYRKSDLGIFSVTVVGHKQ